MSRRRPTTARTGLAAIAAATLLAAGLSGCGGEAAADSASDFPMGPLDEFRNRITGWIWDQDDDVIEAQSIAEQRLIEELVAACMSEQGFEYRTTEPTSGGIFRSSNYTDSGILRGSLEFAERYGFGISSGANTFVAREFDPDEVWVWVNQEVLDAMSETEQAAWWYAYHGPPWDGSEDHDWTQGCSGQARAEVWDYSPPDQWASLQDEMDNLWDQVALDPRMVAMNHAWTGCMAEEGHPGLTARSTLTMELWEEWDLLNGWGVDGLMANWDWEAYPFGPELPVRTPAVFDEFKTREISLAVAAHRCDAEAQVDETHVEVYHDLQAAFVERHRAELEAWAQYAEQRRAERGF